MSEWILGLIEQSGYLGVGFLMFLETVFPPIPSEVIMSLTGIAAARGQLNLWFAIAAGTAGAMLGNILWYLAARALGHDRLKPFVKRHGKWLTVNWRDVQKAHDWFDRYGVWIVLVGRVMPTIRSLISVPAGLLDMRFRNFVIASTVGTAIWTSLLAFAGYKLRENYADIDQWIEPLSNIVLLMLIGGYAWRLFTHKVDAD